MSIILPTPSEKSISIDTANLSAMVRMEVCP